MPWANKLRGFGAMSTPAEMLRRGPHNSSPERSFVLARFTAAGALQMRARVPALPAVGAFRNADDGATTGCGRGARAPSSQRAPHAGCMRSMRVLPITKHFPSQFVLEV